MICKVNKSAWTSADIIKILLTLIDVYKERFKTLSIFIPLE